MGGQEQEWEWKIHFPKFGNGKVMKKKNIPKIREREENENIAKGTTDPRVEFISQDHSSQTLNICKIQILD